MTAGIAYAAKKTKKVSELEGSAKKTHKSMNMKKLKDMAKTRRKNKPIRKRR
jgi:hypothetical protein